MNNWKVIFATVVIFGAGVITGGLLVAHVHLAQFKPVRKLVAKPRTTATNQLVRAADKTKLPPPELLSKQFLLHLNEDLQLTPEQSHAIRRIINESQDLMHKVIQDARLEIREELTPPQRGAFDELMKRPPHSGIFNSNSPSETPAGTNAPAASAPLTNAPAR